MRKPSTIVQSETLVQVGLTHNQAAVYTALVRVGRKPASSVAHEARVTRPLTYKALSELMSMELVVKHNEPGTVAEFSASHPLRLHDMALEQFERAKRAKDSTESILSSLISDFTKVSGQPGVRILQGVQGLKELYADILREQQPIMLIRSPADKSHPAITELTDEQINKQVKAGIRVQAITPLSPHTPRSQLERDVDRLMTRRIVPLDKFSIPAQVMIYANKVSFTAFDASLMTTIVENLAIAGTFRTLFQYIWDSARPEHEQMREAIMRQEDVRKR